MPGIVCVKAQEELPILVLLSHAVGDVHCKCGLSHPGHALDDLDVWRAAGLMLAEKPELVLPAHEIADNGREVTHSKCAPVPGVGGSDGQFGSAAQDALVQLRKLRPRFDALIFDKLATGRHEDGHSVG
jgi:hypothetical protein